MATKRIVDLPTTDTLKNETSVLVNDNGVVKMATANAIQADWDEIDETSPKFIMNKPVTGGLCPLYMISSYEIYAADGTPMTLDKLASDFVKGPIRTVLPSEYNNSLSLEENLINIKQCGTLVGFVVSGDGSVLVDCAYGLTLRRYDTPLKAN